MTGTRSRSIDLVVRIDVAGSGDTGRRFAITIGAEDGSSTRHVVGVSDADWERFGGGFDTRSELVDASIRFLLEQEPKGSILGSFDLGDIARYFPEYGETFTARSAA
jgi:hypothetical protein